MIETLELEAPKNGSHSGTNAVSRPGSRIAGDTVRVATADLPDYQRDTILQLHKYYIEHGLSSNTLAENIGISPAALGLIFRGKYESSLDGMVRKMKNFLDLKEARATVPELEFIETSLSKIIWNTCKAARTYKKIAFMFGDSHIGKTTNLKQLEAKNPLHTIYISIPPGGNISNFLLRCARKFDLSQNIATFRLRERIMDCFNDRMLLLIDEGQRCIPANTDSVRRMETLDYIRDIYDETGCAVAIAANNLFRDSMANEKSPLYKILSRLDRRQVCATQLPEQPEQEDLNTFAAAYKLPPSTGAARELEKTIISTKAIGMWLTILRQAQELATKRKQEISWSHVAQADGAIKYLAGAKN